MRFQDKVVVVTGAARGIGFACAEAYANEGAAVAIVDALGDVAADSAKKLADRGAKTLSVTCDVGDKAAVESMVEQVGRELGPINALSHNAGISIVGDFLTFSEDDFDAVIRVNLKGTFLVGQAVAGHMVANGTRGTIVNMSSVNAVLAIPSIAPYVASKGGVNQITKVMALSLIEHGIRVNAIGPGSIDTEMMAMTNANPKAMATALSRTPVGRLGEPSEMAEIALFLSCDQSSYITGQIIYADGGRLALNYTV